MKWKIDGAQDLPLAVIEDTEDGNGVAEIGGRTADNIKNANLIAAAPELLEACRAANNKLCELNQDAGDTLFIAEELDMLEKAIIKARGN